MDDLTVHAIAKSVAPLIGYEYDEKGSADRDGILHNYARLKSEKCKLSLHKISYGAGKGRIAIGISWPSHPTNYRAYTIDAHRRNGRTYEITVSGEKSPEAIARDIKNRLLHDAEELYAEALVTMNADIDYTDKKLQAAREIAELTGHRFNERDTYNFNPYYYAFGTDAKITISSGNYIKVEFDCKSVADVKQLLEAYGNVKRKIAQAEVSHE